MEIMEEKHLRKWHYLFKFRYKCDLRISTVSYRSKLKGRAKTIVMLAMRIHASLWSEEHLLLALLLLQPLGKTMKYLQAFL